MSVELRPARSTDAGALGDILYRFQQDTEGMPELYTGAEFIAFAGAMIDWEWVTVAEVEHIVETGELDPDNIHTPGIFVDRIVLTTPEKRIEQRTVRPR